MFIPHTEMWLLLMSLQAVPSRAVFDHPTQCPLPTSTPLMVWCLIPYAEALGARFQPNSGNWSCLLLATSPFYGEHFDLICGLLLPRSPHAHAGVTFICRNPRSALMQDTHCLWKDLGMEKSDVSLVGKRQLCLPSAQQRWLRSHSCL